MVQQSKEVGMSLGSKEVGMSLGSIDLKIYNRYVEGDRSGSMPIDKHIDYCTQKRFIIYNFCILLVILQKGTQLSEIKLYSLNSLHPPKHDHSFWFNPKSIQLHDISHPHTWSGPYNWLSEAKCCTFLSSSSLFAPTILSICFPSLINKKVGIACTSHSAITSCTSPVAQSLQIIIPPSTFTNKLDSASHLHHKTLPASTLFYKQELILIMENMIYISVANL